jgi:hypothetical protein
MRPGHVAFIRRCHVERPAGWHATSRGWAAVGSHAHPTVLKLAPPHSHLRRWMAACPPPLPSDGPHLFSVALLPLTLWEMVFETPSFSCGIGLGLGLGLG